MRLNRNGITFDFYTGLHILCVAESILVMCIAQNVEGSAMQVKEVQPWLE